MTGLVSISFRSLSTKEILEAAAAARLDTVEWGGDVHVPAGKVSHAVETRKMTEAYGIGGYSYGSYYKIGASPAEEFSGVLASAAALGTDIIRTWAYNKGSEEVHDWEYENAVADARRICDMAVGKTICLECHNFTLTDDYRATLRFLHDVDRENLAMYWQPNQYRTFAYNLEACKALAPFCRSVHVFSWEGDDRFPLTYHEARWKRYIEILKKDAPEAPFMLEFMHDDRVESLKEAAHELREWLK